MPTTTSNQKELQGPTEIFDIVELDLHQNPSDKGKI